MYVHYLLAAIILNVAMPICTQQATVWHNYLWANYKQLGNHTAAAQQRYQFLLSTKTPPIYTHKGYIHFLYKTHQYAQIISYQSLIMSTFSNDAELQLMLVHALEKTGRTKEAHAQLMAAYKVCPQDAQIVLEVAQFYVNAKELQNALSTVDAFLHTATKKQNHFIFHFIKAQIYVQLKQNTQALTSIKECLDLHTSFDKGWLVRAMIEEQLGQLEDAIQGYTTFLELSGGTNVLISHHLMQLTLQQKIATQRKQQAQTARSYLDNALILCEKKQYKQALACVDTYLHAVPADPNARLLKLQILSNQYAFDQAIKLVHTWIRQDPNNQLWFEALHLLGHNSGALGSVLTTLTAIAHEHPHNIWAAVYAADLHIRMGANNSALATLERIEPHIADPQLKTKILFHLGLLHFEAGNYARTQEYLEQGKALNAQFLPLLNLLAYYYATKGKDTDRAQQVMQSITAQDPHNPHYVDTHAVILYKKKEYEQARTMLQNIHTQHPRDATIAIHLAKTLHKSGDVASARKVLESATAYVHSEYEKKQVAKLAAAWKS